jgi:hypothetical protein
VVVDDNDWSGAELKEERVLELEVKRFVGVGKEKGKGKGGLGMSGWTTGHGR